MVLDRRLFLGALFVFVAAYAVFAIAHIVPPAPYGLADDWRVFYAAGQLGAQGGNVYDPAAMHVAEQAAQHYGRVQPSLDDFTDLPVVAIVLRAFTWLPYWVSFAVFTALGAIASGIALHAWMRHAGWRPAPLWLAAAFCSWIMLVGLFAGQFDAVLLAAAIASLLLMRRDRPWIAGLCMAAVLLKPHVLWPLPLLVVAAWWLPDRTRAIRFAAAAGAALIGGAGAGFLLLPHSVSFFSHLLTFGGRVSAVQPDLSGIPGLLIHLPAGAEIGAATAVAGAAAVAVVAALAARGRLPVAGGGVGGDLIPLAGLALWLALTPYAHPNDDVLLLPLLVLLVGHRGAWLDARWLEVGIIGSLAAGAAFLSSAPLGFAAVLAAAGLWTWRRRALPAAAGAAIALCALALLPTVWPLHVVPVSLTPIAVAVTAVAAVQRLRQGDAAVTQRRDVQPVVLAAGPAGG